MPPKKTPSKRRPRPKTLRDEFAMFYGMGLAARADKFPRTGRTIVKRAGEMADEAMKEREET